MNEAASLYKAVILFGHTTALSGDPYCYTTTIDLTIKSFGLVGVACAVTCAVGGLLRFFSFQGRFSLLPRWVAYCFSSVLNGVFHYVRGGWITAFLQFSRAFLFTSAVGGSLLFFSFQGVFFIALTSGTLISPWGRLCYLGSTCDTLGVQRVFKACTAGNLFGDKITCD